MATEVLFWGIDDIYKELKPYYTQSAANGDFEIAGYALIDGDKISLSDKSGRGGVDELVCEAVIVSSKNNFYDRMKSAEKFGLSRRKIIDGRAFQMSNLDVPRLFKEGVAYGLFEGNRFKEISFAVHRKIYDFPDIGTKVTLGAKSYVENATITGYGINALGNIFIGNYSSLATNILFMLFSANDHNYRHVGTYSLSHTDWKLPDGFKDSPDLGEIHVGNDVWIGHNSTLKSSHATKPLIIGDGAVIAANSVVVKNVPPYAIVGGNPARLIKYRFPEDIIEALLRIKWWDWELDKIHENFKYFNRIEEFIAIHDK